MQGRTDAALQLCRAFELTDNDVHPITGALRSANDEQWILINTHCSPAELPEELSGWVEPVALPAVFVPRCILAMYALGREIPSKQTLFPDDEEA